MFEFLGRNDGNVININDLDDLIGKINLVDIREPYEYQAGSIKTSVNIPMAHLLKEPDKYLKKENQYYIMCQSGGRSSRACGTLSKLGFNVVNISGGMGVYVGTNKQ